MLKDATLASGSEATAGVCRSLERSPYGAGALGGAAPQGAEVPGGQPPGMRGVRCSVDHEAGPKRKYKIRTFGF